MKTTKGVISPLDKLTLTQKVLRRWISDLTPPEFMVVMYVFDRTIMWGRAEKRITQEEFLTGNALNKGLPLSRMTLHRAIQALVHRGALSVSGSRRAGMAYALNFDWGIEDDMLKVSKKKGLTAPSPATEEAAEFFGDENNVQLSNPDTTDVSKVDNSCIDLRQHIGEYPQKDTRTDLVVSAPMARLERALEKVREVSEAKGAEKRIRVRNRFSALALQDVWLEAMAEHHRGVPRITWSPRARGLITTHHKNGVFREVAADLFVVWVIENWSMLMAGPFDWMKDKPLVPVFEFVAVNCHRFLAAYANKEAMAQEASLTGEEQLRSRLRRQGYTPQEIERRMAQADERIARRQNRRERIERNLDAAASTRRNNVSNAPGGTNPANTVRVVEDPSQILPISGFEWEEDEE